MVKNFERQVLLAKNESSYGTDSVPTAAANAIPIVEATKPEIDVSLIERGHPFPALAKLNPLAGAKMAKIAFKMEYFGSGTAITPPRIGDLWEACGLAETIGGADVTYTPASASLKSNTMYFYLDGLLYKLLGAVGNFKMSGKAGEPVYFEFEKVGLYQDDADANIVSPTFESNYRIPPLSMSVSMTLDSIATFVLREFNIDMGIPIINRLDMKATHGYAGFMVGKRNPTGNIIIEAESKATYDTLTKFKNSTEVACTITIGSIAGNKLEISMPKMTYTNVGIENADGLVTFNLPITLNYNSGSGGGDISLKHF